MRVNWSTYLSFQGLFFLIRKSSLAPWLPVNKNQKKELYSLLKEGLIKNEKGTILSLLLLSTQISLIERNGIFVLGKSGVNTG